MITKSTELEEVFFYITNIAISYIITYIPLMGNTNGIIFTNKMACHKTFLKGDVI